MRLASISGAIVGFVFLAQLALAQQGPSFSCANVKQPWAVVICSDAGLSGLDLSIGEKYKAVRDTVAGNTLLAFIDNQLNWIAATKAECRIPETGSVEPRNTPSLAGCLRARFSQRVAAFDNGSWADPRADYELGLDQTAREQVQGRLATLGHYKDKPDGRFGPGMRHAIAAAQRQFGLPQSGFVTGGLVGKLDLNFVVQNPAPASPAFRQVDGGQQIAARPACRTSSAAPSGPQVTVSLDAGAARVGEPVTLTWSLTAMAERQTDPTYFMVKVPGISRFEGSGFFALAGGASGPRDITFGLDQTRAIVPLHTVLFKPSGIIQILPWTAGALSLEWAVVRADECGERILDSGKLEPIAIRPGLPIVMAYDNKAEGQPDRVIRALKGPYQVRVYGDHFLVVEADSGSLVIKRQGWNPTFSPTGRFLVVNLTKDDNTYEIIDLPTRRIIGHFGAEELSWSHSDSFLYSGEDHAGKMEIVRTLHGRRSDQRSVVHTRVERRMLGLGYHGAGEDSEPYPFILSHKPTLDIEPWGQYHHASSARDVWSFDLSIEQGIVTFSCTDKNGWCSQAQPLSVYDLAADRPNKIYQNGADGYLAFSRDFGLPAPNLSGWNPRERPQTTNIRARLCEDQGDFASNFKELSS